jgi:hypothetical protein
VATSLAYPTREMKLLNAVVCYETSLREKQTCGSVRSSLSAPARLATVGSEAAETMHLTIPVWKRPRGYFHDCQRHGGQRARLDDMPNISELP